MRVRRIVTGHRPDGTSTIVSDQVPPRSHDYQHIPGMSETLVWATEPGEPIPTTGADPTPQVTSFVPRPGGTRCLVVRFPPDSVFASDDFDPERAAAEQRVASPGLAERFEPGTGGMHRTDSVDYVFVLEGNLWLELDQGQEVALHPGDVVGQNGTRHAWRNRGTTPAVLGVVLVGASRPSPT
ncbi:MAG TPA: cupin domain-containing protein [Candidatus Dormibacteraeota bacterium]|nr:cupin domain-containing protein [Candidatus Dormibacteraeota bacterium]